MGRDILRGFLRGGKTTRFFAKETLTMKEEYGKEKNGFVLVGSGGAYQVSD